MSTPPTVHASDGKAAEPSLGERAAEMIERLYDPGPIPGPEPTDLDYEVVNLCDELRGPNALIIARHHAEERAEVEKVRSVLNELERLLTTYSRLDSKCSFCRIPQHYADAALTALRTASQSPTT